MSIGKINTVPNFLSRLGFSEPRGPFSLEKVEILRSQRWVVLTFLSLALPHFAFKRKIDHHFNKNLDAQSGSTSKFSRNSGIEGTQFIDHWTLCSQLERVIRYFFLKGERVEGEKLRLLLEGIFLVTNAELVIEFNAGGTRATRPRETLFLGIRFPRKTSNESL